MKYKIYKLINLDTNEIIYVGITGCGKTRLARTIADLYTKG